MYLVILHLLFQCCDFVMQLFVCSICAVDLQQEQEDMNGQQRQVVSSLVTPFEDMLDLDLKTWDKRANFQLH